MSRPHRRPSHRRHTEASQGPEPSTPHRRRTEAPRDPEPSTPHRRCTEAPRGPESSPGASTLCRLGLPLLGSGLDASSAEWQPPGS